LQNEGLAGGLYTSKQDAARPHYIEVTDVLAGMKENIAVGQRHFTVHECVDSVEPSN
jgi:hypothetical protein